jgi:hypothetical protein
MSSLPIPSTSIYSNRDSKMLRYSPNSKPTALVRPERQPLYLKGQVALNKFGCPASGEDHSPFLVQLPKNSAVSTNFRALLSANRGSFFFLPYKNQSIRRTIFALNSQPYEGKAEEWLASEHNSFRRVSCPTSQNRTGPLGEQSSRLTNFTKTITQGQARMPYSHNPRMDNRMN